MSPHRGNQLIQAAEEKEYRHQKADYSEENCDQQGQEKTFPPPNHERLDDLDNTRKHKQPSKKHHRNYGRRGGPNDRDDAKHHQHDPKGEEPSPVMNHLWGSSNYHIDWTKHCQLSFHARITQKPQLQPDCSSPHVSLILFAGMAAPVYFFGYLDPGFPFCTLGGPHRRCLRRFCLTLPQVVRAPALSGSSTRSSVLPYRQTALGSKPSWPWQHCLPRVARNPAPPSCCPEQPQ